MAFWYGMRVRFTETVTVDANGTTTVFPAGARDVVTGLRGRYVRVSGLWIPKAFVTGGVS